MSGEWQIRFDGGHQQRYLPDRAAVLRYVLAIAPHAASTRFEVFTEAEPVTLTDGSPGGRRFALAEVIDLGRPGEADRLRALLAEEHPTPNRNTCFETHVSAHPPLPSDTDKPTSPGRSP